MAIIGISGKIGAGKDTVGKIIQYLTNCKQNDSRIGTLEHFNLFCDLIIYDQNWQIKKLAYKLKQCVSIITGIPVEDLEKEEVKNKVLGEEWNVVDKVCNICGKNWNNEHFNLFNLTNGKAYCSSCKNGIYLDSTKKITALFADYKSKGNLAFERLDSSERLPLTNDPNDFMFPKWIITDVRFPNELQAIKDKGGIVIRVTKGSLEQQLCDAINDKYNTHVTKDDLIKETFDELRTFEHPSETALDNATFDYTISAKEGDIESLIQQTKEILIKEKIIK
jgi:hypothetical protein